MTKTLARILFIAYSFIAYTASAQSVFHGRVIDRITREPLEMAFVTDLRTQQNVLTDQGGYFNLRGISLPAVLEVSIIGFTSQKISVTSANRALLTIGLDKGILNLKEVTVTNSASTGIGAFHTL